MLMAENSSRFERRLKGMMKNWAVMKWQSPSVIGLTYGFILFRKSLKKVIEKMKEESIQVSEMFLMHQVKVSS